MSDMISIQSEQHSMAISQFDKILVEFAHYRGTLLHSMVFASASTSTPSELRDALDAKWGRLNDRAI